MAKRFADTELWDMGWFIRLPAKLKCAWQYMNARCDGVGVWNVSLEALSFYTGESISRDEFDAAFGPKLVWLDPERVWIVTFVPEQYKKLSPQNQAGRGIMRRIVVMTEGLPLDPTTAELVQRFRDLLASHQTLTRPSPDVVDPSKEEEEEEEEGSEEKGGVGEKEPEPPEPVPTDELPEDIPPELRDQLVVDVMTTHKLAVDVGRGLQLLMGTYQHRGPAWLRRHLLGFGTVAGDSRYRSIPPPDRARLYLDAQDRKDAKHEKELAGIQPRGAPVAASGRESLDAIRAEAERDKASVAEAAANPADPRKVAALKAQLPWNRAGGTTT